MKNLEEIKAILDQVKSLVKEKYHISELGIFGDYVKGEVRSHIAVGWVDARKPSNHKSLHTQIGPQ